MSGHAIGVCSWSLRPADPAALIDRLQRLDMAAVQLALSPMIRDEATWGEAIGILHNSGVETLSGMIAMAGEDYTTLESIRKTGGVRLDALWEENLEHARLAADLAANAEIRLVTFHAGFLPEDPTDPQRTVMLDRLAAMADVFADRGVRVGLETGQETATTLLAALDELGRDNVGANFDPANMILYGKGDPVRALMSLAPHVLQIHIKDALPSPSPGIWGRETPVGQGAVDWDRFLDVALDIKPAVNLVIERENTPQADRDIATARSLVEHHVARHRRGE